MRLLCFKKFSELNFLAGDVTKTRPARHLCEHQSKQRILVKGAGTVKNVPIRGYQP